MKSFVLAAWLLCLWTFPCLSTFAGQGNRLTIGTAFGPTASVPDPAKGSNGWYLIEAGVFETLFALDFDMELVPCLADSYRNISPLVWEIKLKKGVLFHDHTPLTASTVKWSIERLIDEKSAVFNKPIQNLLDIRAITVVDDYTLRLETNQPNAAFI